MSNTTTYTKTSAAMYLSPFVPSSHIWKSGILSGGKAREVSRNLKADKYMSNSAWEKFTGPFLSWAPRTTLASLDGPQNK